MRIRLTLVTVATALVGAFVAPPPPPRTTSPR